MWRRLWSAHYFNPHSPCGERRSKARYIVRADKFQSTLPLRGATDEWLPPERGERNISIHTPLAGSDAALINALGGDTKFQSTLPLRGATAEMRHF